LTRDRPTPYRRRREPRARATSFHFFIAYSAPERLGVARLLAVAAVVTVGARWLLVIAMPVSGEWVQGGFFACRLWEFALGMAAGVLWPKWPAAIDATAAMTVGASSLYFGERMRSLDTATFVVGAGGIIAILALGAMALERAVNVLTSRILGSGPASGTP
jgi:hypothetical protein